MYRKTYRIHNLFDRELSKKYTSDAHPCFRLQTFKVVFILF